ncbi:hypothetical protein K2173_019894 [Erythroxylum novogranatense]|uniref:Uncharacterized protein n=1 Tax=Erythroxylum novogranatense TaxID=1862640 RepID=A0AAV8U996_9ROSI|nr:hypothetical protein K2173_019894 [Erythroxylum novogranatense]
MVVEKRKRNVRGPNSSLGKNIASNKQGSCFAISDERNDDFQGDIPASKENVPFDKNIPNSSDFGQENSPSFSSRDFEASSSYGRGSIKKQGMIRSQFSKKKGPSANIAKPTFGDFFDFKNKVAAEDNLTVLPSNLNPKLHSVVGKERLVPLITCPAISDMHIEGAAASELNVGQYSSRSPDESNAFVKDTSDLMHVDGSRLLHSDGLINVEDDVSLEENEPLDPHLRED